MSDPATFRINQGVGTGTYGRARRDLQLFADDGAISGEAENKAETSYLWTLESLVPGAAAITVNNNTTHTCNFNVVTIGGYLLKLLANSGEVDEDVMIRYVGVPLANIGLSVPAIDETNEDNSLTPYDGHDGAGGKMYDLFAWVDAHGNKLTTGAGNPNGVVAGIWGDRYIDTTNITRYEKMSASGNTGWMVL